MIEKIIFKEIFSYVNKDTKENLDLFSYNTKNYKILFTILQSITKISIPWIYKQLTPEKLR